jgi:branched-chain amino acid transport system substrate-binding protein
MSDRTLILVTALAVMAGTGGEARAENAPGITDTEIKIGQTMPYTGPASAYAADGEGAVAYFKMINDQGGVNGRKIVISSLDDGYNPTKAVELTQKLVEEDHVAFIFESLGTPSNVAIQPYLTQHKIPQLFVASGADRWGDYQNFPWTMGWQPSYRVEAAIYAKYILRTNPDAKVAVLYQNDQFGKDYLAGLKDVFGSAYDKIVVKTATYEATDTMVDTQIEALKNSGADTLISAVTPKFAARTIHVVYSLNWHPLHFVSSVSASIPAVLEPVGFEKALGLITAAYLKDPSDPSFKDDPGLNEWRAFMAKYLPQGDTTEGGYIQGYSMAATLVQVLKQCGNDLSRENIMRQAANLQNLQLPGLLPGIVVNTSPTNFHPIQAQQLSRFDGHAWTRFGDVLTAAPQGWWEYVASAFFR